jgi:hypothetical protein
MTEGEGREGEWSPSYPDDFAPRERAHGTYLTGGWSCPTDGLEVWGAWKKLSPVPGIGSHSSVAQPLA